MFRHISVFKVKNEAEVAHMAALLKEAGETCPSVLHSEVGLNFTQLEPGAPGPLFGDIVQIIDFRTKEECLAWPSTPEHMKLLKEGPEMFQVMAADYEI